MNTLQAQLYGKSDLCPCPSCHPFTEGSQAELKNFAVGQRVRMTDEWRRAYWYWDPKNAEAGEVIAVGPRYLQIRFSWGSVPAYPGNVEHAR